MAKKRIPWRFLCKCVFIPTEAYRDSWVMGSMTIDQHSYESGADYCPDAECKKCAGFGDIREPAL